MLSTLRHSRRALTTVTVRQASDLTSPASRQADESSTVTSIDGSCAGVRSVQDGEIGATVMQFPSRMGELAVEAIIDFVETGEKPSGVIDSGTTLITDDPVEGVESEDSAWGLENCWGE